MSVIRMLAMDLDGTLAVGAYGVSPATRQALGRVRDAGVQLVIATGRRYGSALRVVESLALPTPILCLAGTLLKGDAGETLFAESLDRDTLAQIAGIFGEFGLSAVGYRDAHAAGGPEILFDRSADWNEVITRYFERTSSPVQACPSFRDASHDDVLLVSSFAAREPLVKAQAAIHARLPGQLSTNVMPAPGMPCHYMEVVRSGVTKWSGLQRLAEQRGIGAHEVCAVGDELNDLQMIRGAGMGVAMGNATEALKQAADWVCGRNDEDGIVDIVERILDGRSPR